MMVDFVKGQTVTFAKRAAGSPAGGWGGGKEFRTGAVAEVTTVRKNVITVRAPQGGNLYSFNVSREALATPNGEVWEGPTEPARKLGDVPEGGIDPNDPGLEWLWKDAAKLASNYGLCSDYDRLADRLNIPGRERQITVSVKVNGLDVVSTVKARNEKQAKEIVLEKINPTVPVPNVSERNILNGAGI